ncbi:MbtH family protein [Streptomyces sp. NPDC127117]|uniref:MbtH family protein n=1 Tax=Streptomyces sp. NPDC127117 TaxID=3345368 RepID=UPI00364059BF
MSDQEADLTMPYRVVVNDEEQYSIWPEGREVPAGWRVVREAAPKADCLEYIEEVWTDMRPLSIRRRAPKSEPVPGAR